MEAALQANTCTLRGTILGLAREHAGQLDCDLDIGLNTPQDPDPALHKTWGSTSSVHDVSQASSIQGVTKKVGANSNPWMA